MEAKYPSRFEIVLAQSVFRHFDRCDGYCHAQMILQPGFSQTGMNDAPLGTDGHRNYNTASEMSICPAVSFDRLHPD